MSCRSGLIKSEQQLKECTDWRDISNSTGHNPVERIMTDTDHTQKVNNTAEELHQMRKQPDMFICVFSVYFIKIKCVNGFAQKIMSSLKIQKAEAHALYRCTAANKVGVDSRIIFFHVTREHCASLFFTWTVSAIVSVFFTSIHILSVSVRWPRGERVTIQ